MKLSITHGNIDITGPAHVQELEITSYMDEDGEIRYPTITLIANGELEAGAIYVDGNLTDIEHITAMGILIDHPIV